LRWSVDNFALLAEWRAVLLRVIKYSAALLMRENGRERENLGRSSRGSSYGPKSHNGVVVEGGVA
jgi:ABC-type uncharacterized transport system fused permease/ATPase subunit